MDSAGVGYDYDAEAELEANYHNKDHLIYLFGEDSDGMKIVTFDPVKYELKRKKVSINT